LVSALFPRHSGPRPLDSQRHAGALIQAPAWLPTPIADHGEIRRAYGKVLVLHREGGVEWRVVRLDAKTQRPSLGDKLRVADLAGWGL